MSAIARAASEIAGRAGAVGAAVAGAGAGSVGPLAVGLAAKMVEQIHAGAKFEGRVTFDLPGPFDPVVDVIAEVRLDDGHLRIKELHIKPSL